MATFQSSERLIWREEGARRCRRLGWWRLLFVWGFDIGI